MPPKKSYRRCAYRSCPFQTDTATSFYQFPKDPQRAAVWIKACDREDISTLDWDNNRSKYLLCQNHFEEKDYTKGGNGAYKTLFINAIPKIIPGALKPHHIIDQSAASKKLGEASKKINILSGTNMEHKTLHQQTAEEEIKLRPFTKIKLEVGTNMDHKRVHQQTAPEEITARPFKKIKLGSATVDAEVVPGGVIIALEEPTINMDQTNVAAEQDPLKLPDSYNPTNNTAVSHSSTALLKSAHNPSNNAAVSHSSTALPKSAHNSTNNAAVSHSFTALLKSADNPTNTAAVSHSSTVCLKSADNPTNNAAVSHSSTSLLKSALSSASAPAVKQNKPLVLKKVPSDQAIILDKIRKIAANQAEMVKNFKFAPKVGVLNVDQINSAAVKLLASKEAKPVTVDLTLDDEVEIHDPTPNINVRPTSENSIVNDDSPSTGEVNFISNQNADKEREIITQKIATKCRIPNCVGGKYYFPAPSNSRVLNLWRWCILDTTLQAQELLCNNHFLDVDILETPLKGNICKLKEHVVPSLEKVENGCAMPMCKNKSINTPNMYSIPTWSTYLQWIRIMGNIKYARTVDLLKYRVCELHFSNVTSTNMFDLVPTANIPASPQYDNRLQEFIKSRHEIENGIQSETSCAHTKCAKEKTDAGVRFIKFPKEYYRAISWLTLCNRGDIVFKKKDEVEKFVAESNGVCFDHYKYIFTKLLNKGTPHDKVANTVHGEITTGQEVPVVYKQHIAEAIAEKRKIEDEVTYVPIRDYCAFVNCSTHIKNMTVKKYRFPIDKDLLEEWKRNAGIAEFIEEGYLKACFICGKHFTAIQFTEWRTLLMASVPVHHELYTDPKATHPNAHWIRKQRLTKKKYVFLPKPIPPLLQDNSLEVITTKHDSHVVNQTRAVLPKPSTYFPLVNTRPGIAQAPPLQGNILTVTTNPRVAPVQGNHFSVVDTEPINSVNINANLQKEDKYKCKFDKSQNRWLLTPTLPTLPTKCCVKHCKEDEESTVLFRFPFGFRGRFNLWIKAVENRADISEEKELAYKSEKICRNHFEARFLLAENRLCPLAIPTLNLMDPNDIKDGQTLDTSVVWQDRDILLQDIPQFKGHVKAKAILHEDSIEFPNLKRELRFGKDCPKKSINKFPYNIYRLPYNNTKLVDEHVKVKHALQVHTAIIIDDDDEAEKAAIDMICGILKANNEAPPRGDRQIQNA